MAVGTRELGIFATNFGISKIANKNHQDTTAGKDQKDTQVQHERLERTEGAPMQPHR
jgi:hypothetical protein